MQGGSHCFKQSLRVPLVEKKGLEVTKREKMINTTVHETK